MIETKHLIEFIKRDYDLRDALESEYTAEIVARLERYDEMKKGIEKMIRDARDSSVVDK